MSEYEPGTVADVKYGPISDVPIRCLFDGVTWRGKGTSMTTGDLTNIRPLHVLADDEVAVRADDLRETLRHDTWAWRSAGETALIEALDAYDAARTPQIEEPQQIGAVVHLPDRSRWVRTDDPYADPYPWRCVNGEETTSWPHLVKLGVRLDEEVGR